MYKFLDKIFVNYFERCILCVRFREWLDLLTALSYFSELGVRSTDNK